MPGMRRVPVDSKGRITLPSQYRYMYHHFPGNWVVCLVLQRERIDVLPYERFMERSMSLLRESFHPEDLNARRRLAVDKEIKCLDNQGRLTLSRRMREKLGIKAEAVLIWMGGWVEIWPVEGFKKWDKETASLDEYELRMRSSSVSLPQEGASTAPAQQEQSESEKEK